MGFAHACGQKRVHPVLIGACGQKRVHQVLIAACGQKRCSDAQAYAGTTGMTRRSMHHALNTVFPPPHRAYPCSLQCAGSGPASLLDGCSTRARHTCSTCACHTCLACACHIFLTRALDVCLTRGVARWRHRLIAMSATANARLRSSSRGESGVAVV
eukprot:365375-Chlamydomonas_euryale.AAC.10